jgi:hypothetical protein
MHSRRRIVRFSSFSIGKTPLANDLPIPKGAFYTSCTVVATLIGALTNSICFWK